MAIAIISNDAESYQSTISLQLVHVPTATTSQTVEVTKPWCADLELQDFHHLKFLQTVTEGTVQVSFKPENLQECFN